MKKSIKISIVCVVSIVVVLLGALLINWFCTDVFVVYVPGTRDWQEVEIEKYGTIKIPTDWVVTEKDDYIYLSNRDLDNKDCKIYAVGVQEQEKNTEKFMVDSEFLGAVEIVAEYSQDKYVRSYSNSAIVSLETCTINEKENQNYMIEILSLNTNYYYSFIFVDKDVSLDQITQIAKTYSLTQ